MRPMFGCHEQAENGTNHEPFLKSSFPNTYAVLDTLELPPETEVMMIDLMHSYWRKTFESSNWIRPMMIDVFIVFHGKYVNEIYLRTYDQCKDILSTLA